MVAWGAWKGEPSVCVCVGGRRLVCVWGGRGEGVAESYLALLSVFGGSGKVDAAWSRCVCG